MTKNLTLIALGLGLSVLSTQAAIRTAASPSLNDVNSAITAAVDGDTVKIPAGTATWGSALNLKKAITLMGAGSKSTIINGSGNTMMTLSLPADKPVRITGINFTNAKGTAVPTFIIVGRSQSSVGVPITQMRIDHCNFTFGKRAINPDGYVYGVIDHNTFLNCDIAVGINGDNNPAWNRPIEPGSANTICIEDNTFTMDNTVTGQLNEQIYHQEGTRSTIRHNTFDGTKYTNASSLFFDCHGNQGYYSGNTSKDFRGTILVELYNNTMKAYKTYRMTYMRAGMILAYNNTMSCVSGSAAAFGLSEEESWQTQFFNPLKTSWPAQDQINNSFFWNNTMNGAAVTAVTLWNAKDSTFIQKGRDYWMTAPSSVSKYYPYKALVYPHPMVTAQDGGTTAAPSAPKNLKVISQ